MEGERSKENGGKRSMEIDGKEDYGNRQENGGKEGGRRERGVGKQVGKWRERGVGKQQNGEKEG